MSSTESTLKLVKALEAGADALVRCDDRGTAVVLYAHALSLRQGLVFECDVDESAGMAEVVELQGYSRKAPCQ